MIRFDWIASYRIAYVCLHAYFSHFEPSVATRKIRENPKTSLLQIFRWNCGWGASERDRVRVVVVVVVFSMVGHPFVGVVVFVNALMIQTSNRYIHTHIYAHQVKNAEGPMESEREKKRRKKGIK